MLDRPTELSLEQEFQLKSFANQVQTMSREQAQEFLIVLHEQMIIRETMYRDFSIHEWNLDSDTVSKFSK
jgi:Phycobilisome degradation protein nblA